MVQRHSSELYFTLDVYALLRLGCLNIPYFPYAVIWPEFLTRLPTVCGKRWTIEKRLPTAELNANDNKSHYGFKVYRMFTTKRILCLESIYRENTNWFPKKEARRIKRFGLNCLLGQFPNKFSFPPTHKPATDSAQRTGICAISIVAFVST